MFAVGIAAIKMSGNDKTLIVHSYLVFLSKAIQTTQLHISWNSVLSHLYIFLKKWEQKTFDIYFPLSFNAQVNVKKELITCICKREGMCKYKEKAKTGRLC